MRHAFSLSLSLSHTHTHTHALTHPQSHPHPCGHPCGSKPRLDDLGTSSPLTLPYPHARVPISDARLPNFQVDGFHRVAAARPCRAFGAVTSVSTTRLLRARLTRAWKRQRLMRALLQRDQ
eukprot:3211765-Pleurochrysis_carterae.AAC.3